MSLQISKRHAGSRHLLWQVDHTASAPITGMSRLILSFVKGGVVFPASEALDVQTERKSNTKKKTTPSQLALASQNDLRSAIVGAWDSVGQSFDQFCLLVGGSTLSEMMEGDASELAGEAHGRNVDKHGQIWGTT